MADGYVTDIEYAAGFYREQTPAWIDLALLVAGREPPARGPGGAFRYLELGCGQGVTAAVIAASEPAAEVHAVDFNPTHVARARQLARGAGLGNLHVHEASFEDLAGGGPDLGRFDYATLHGVFSWVAPATRDAITRLLRRCLEPGGAAYLSYNALPGWAPGIPVQRLLRDLARAERGGSDRRAAAAARTLLAIQATGARYLAGNPFVDAIRQALEQGHLSYLAHEYLAADWQPLAFAEVADALAAAKLEFAAPADLLENFPEVCLEPAQREALAAIPEEGLRQTVRDVMTARRFRRDVFTRGGARLGRADWERRLREVALALVVPPARLAYSIEVALGRASLSEAAYGPAYAALAEAPRTIGELLDLPQLADHPMTPAELLAMLCASGQAAPWRPSDPAGDAAARRLNLALVGMLDSLGENAALSLASARVPTGLPAAGYAMRVLAAPDMGPGGLEALAREVHGRLVGGGGTPEGGLPGLRGRLEEVAADLLPLWRRLGASGSERSSGDWQCTQ